MDLPGTVLLVSNLQIGNYENLFQIDLCRNPGSMDSLGLPSMALDTLCGEVDGTLVDGA